MVGAFFAARMVLYAFFEARMVLALTIVSASTILASIIRTDKESSYRLQDSLQLKDLGSINKVSLEFTCDNTISVRYRLINCLLDL